KAKKRKKSLTRLALIGAACAVFAVAGVFLFKKFVVPQLNYRKAVTLMESGNQDEAYLMLHKLNVRNSSDLIAEITKDRLKDAEIGSTVLLGTYPQGPKAAKAKNQESTGIEWIVLDRDGSKLLLVSKYALNCLPYQTMKDSLVADTWQASLIRTWLNKTFAPEAFDDGESRFLVNMNMDEEAGGKKAFLPGLDKVFLLSISEAEQYFPDDEARRCAPTRYAVDCGAYRSRAINTCFWWLRTTVEYTDTTLEGRPSETVTRAALVGSTGRIVDIGHYMYNMNYAVRPAVWVDLEAADGLEFNK
ncbi:MAG: hypothetical protein IK064_03055, partial [Clostridia bacterium]|nr:hypothetical protein [Clostridia bacterium]